MFASDTLCICLRLCVEYHSSMYELPRRSLSCLNFHMFIDYRLIASVQFCTFLSMLRVSNEKTCWIILVMERKGSLTFGCGLSLVKLVMQNKGCDVH